MKDAVFILFLSLIPIGMYGSIIWISTNVAPIKNSCGRAIDRAIEDGAICSVGDDLVNRCYNIIPTKRSADE